MNEKQESEYLYDKRFICDVCNREFTAKQVRTGKARFEGTDDILKPQYTGIDCTKYDVIMCPHCGYAAIPRKYGKLTTKQGVSCRKVPEYIQSAYNGFKEAVSTEYLPICGMNEITLCYLLASLAYRCKDYDNAKKNISLIVVSKAASDTIKKKTRILLEHVIEEEQNKTVD